MPVTCNEKLGSGTLTKADSGEDGSAELLYIIEGTSDEQTALDQLKATAPATHKGLTRQECNVEPTDDAERWTGTASYSLDPADGETTFSFDTGGGTQHITNSLETIHEVVEVGSAPDFKGAIGVTPDAVEGVDITVPVFNFEANVSKDAASVTQAYLEALYDLTGKVNDDAFTITIEGVTLSYEAGEVLFLGASGSATKGSGQWSFNLKFAASPNKKEITVGDIVLGDGFTVVKKGWEYLWVRYKDVEDATAKMVVKRPFALYVEKVYEEGDFSVLQ